MDSKIAMFEAARLGNVEVLKNLLQQNPSILDDIKLTSLTESLLHAATKSGQLDFVRELLKIDGDVAGEVDGEGFRALDIAVITGKVEIVKDILSFDHELARLTGNDSRSALHYAAAKGRVEIIGELLSACPDCLEWVTVRGENPLHLAVKNYQFDAFSELVKWVERLGKESMVNAQDCDGNTVLHLAVSTKQYACLKLVVDESSFMRGKIDVNLQNAKGLTPLDISDMIMSDCYDANVRATLQEAGGANSKAQQSFSSKKTDDSQLDSQLDVDNKPKGWFEYLKFDKDKESPSETRNAMLVVVALIVTITYQAGINPPSILFKPTIITNSTDVIERENDPSMYTGDFTFLFGNALGFSTSCTMLEYLTKGFPLYRELFISICTMSFTYFSAISLSTRGRESVTTMVDYIVPIALAIPCAVRLIPFLVKKAFGNDHRVRRTHPV